MAEPVRDNRLTWGILVLGALLLVAFFFIWGVGNNLSTVDQRSQLLEARLAELPNADAIAAVEKRQAELEAAIGALQMPDMDVVQKQVSDLSSDIAALQARFADFTVPGIDQLVARLAAVEAEVGGIKVPDLTAVDAGLAELKTSVQSLQTQLGDFAPARVDELATRLDALAQEMAAVDPAVPSLTDQLNGLNGRLDDMETKVAAITVPDVGPLETRLGTVAADLEVLKTSVAAAATTDQVGAIDARLTSLDAQMSESNAGLASVRGDATALQAQVGELRTALASRAGSAEVTALSDRLDALGAQIAGLPAIDTTTFEADVASLRSGLDALAAQVAALPPAAEIAALRSDLNDLLNTPRAVRPPRLLDRIYFGPSSTSVSADESAKIAAVAQQLLAAPATLELVGFSDSQGPAELNRSLSLRRAAAVRLALLGAGVDPAAVTSITGLGEDAPPIDAGDDADEAGNRVVLIYGSM